MDDVIVVHDLDLENLPVKHQLGRMAAGSLAAFAANRAAEAAYDKILIVLRNRRK